MLGDSIDLQAQTIIQGSDQGDLIVVGSSQTNADGLYVHGGVGTIEVASALTIERATEVDNVAFIDIAPTISGGLGDDEIHVGDLGANATGNEGDDIIYGGRLDDWLAGGDGNDVINAGARSGGVGGDGNFLAGNDGNDLLIGREGSDWLEGGDGVDTLEGGDGGDVLAGGAGDGDVLRGGRGDDHYIFRLGDGEDITRDESGESLQRVVSQAYGGLDQSQIDDRVAEAVSGALFRSGSGLNNWSGGGTHVVSSGKSAGGEDILTLGQGIGLEDIKISQSNDGADLIIELHPDGVFSGDRMTLRDWFSDFNKIEILRFADGNEIRLADLDTFIVGSDGDDTIIGTDGNDFVHTGNGDDLAYLLAGNDVGIGSGGNDSLYGGRGDDIVLGGIGDDYLIGDAGDDFVSGGAGDDYVTGDRGDDVLAGGAGDDEAIGGHGSDIFKYERGDGRDVLIDGLSDEWDVVWISGDGYQNGYDRDPYGNITSSDGSIVFDGSTWSSYVRYDITSGELLLHNPFDPDQIYADAGFSDVLEFGIGIDLNDIQIASSEDGKDLVLGIEAFGGSPSPFAQLTDQIILKGWGASGSTEARGSIETFVFFNTGALRVADHHLAGGTDGDDTVVGQQGAENWLTGGLGDDTLTGGDENDILNGNAGSDHIEGGDGSGCTVGRIGQ